MLIRAILIALTTIGVANAQEPDVAAGELFYSLYCVQCHGVNATGDGPMAELFAIDTPDLTVLSKHNGGVFPIAEVAQKIDGRDELLAHGGEMPLFGQFLDRGQTVALRLPSGQPILAPQTLADLVTYLEILQIQ